MTICVASDFSYEKMDAHGYSSESHRPWPSGCKPWPVFQKLSKMDSPEKEVKKGNSPNSWQAFAVTNLLVKKWIHFFPPRFFSAAQFFCSILGPCNLFRPNSFQATCSGTDEDEKKLRGKKKKSQKLKLSEWGKKHLHNRRLRGHLMIAMF